MDLLLSSASTFLIPALQFVFITPDTRLVPLSIIERGLLPPTTTLKKLFWSADVEKLREEFSSVRELGAPAVEEWQKGLHTRGSVQRSETAKLEKFSDSGGIASMRSVLYPGYKSLNAALPGPSAVEKKKSQDATPGKWLDINFMHDINKIGTPLECLIISSSWRHSTKVWSF